MSTAEPTAPSAPITVDLTAQERVALRKEAEIATTAELHYYVRDGDRESYVRNLEIAVGAGYVLDAIGWKDSDDSLRCEFPAKAVEWLRARRTELAAMDEAERVAADVKTVRLLDWLLNQDQTPTP